MRFLHRVCALFLVLISLLAVSASAASLPKGMTFTDKMPSGQIKAVIISETVNFYGTDGTLRSLSRGDEITVKGMQDKYYAKVVAGGVKGYVSAAAIMSLTGVSAYVSQDCNAYEYGGSRKAKVVWGTKVYIVGRYTDTSSIEWYLCTDKDGKALAYIKKDNLYR